MFHNNPGVILLVYFLLTDFAAKKNMSFKSQKHFILSLFLFMHIFCLKLCQSLKLIKMKHKYINIESIAYRNYNKRMQK